MRWVLRLSISIAGLGFALPARGQGLAKSIAGTRGPNPTSATEGNFGLTGISYPIAAHPLPTRLSTDGTLALFHRIADPIPEGEEAGTTPKGHEFPPTLALISPAHYQVGRAADRFVLVDEIRFALHGIGGGDETLAGLWGNIRNQQAGM